MKTSATLKKITKRAKEIRKEAGTTTKTVKVVKYKMNYRDAVKKASRELRASGQFKTRKSKK